MSGDETLTPALELARRERMRFPNESPDYRRAREALLAEEIELRRQIERVAEQRRALPPGGQVPQDYRFEGERGPTLLSDLFGDKTTLVTYSFMFGPQRERPCPMCTSLGVHGIHPSRREPPSFLERGDGTGVGRSGSGSAGARRI